MIELRPTKDFLLGQLEECVRNAVRLGQSRALKHCETDVPAEADVARHTVDAFLEELDLRFDLVTAEDAR